MIIAYTKTLKGYWSLFLITFIHCHREKDLKWIYPQQRAFDEFVILEPEAATSGLMLDFFNQSSKNTLQPSDYQYFSSKFRHHPLRSHSSAHRLSPEEKMELVRLHNLYRASTTPPAGDMEYMKWEVKLEEMAQIWADTCHFKHGIAEKSKHFSKIGQNLYLGTYRDIEVPLHHWYDEIKYYDYSHARCLGVQCGHYLTMVWAKSNLVGCALTFCHSKYYLVCNYFPPGNIPGEKPFRVGKPCSLCGTRDGGLCNNNLCVTKDDCIRDNLRCYCNLKCHNCGVLQRRKCACSCKNGWDFIDCSVQCMDESNYCGRSPGFPNKVACPTNYRKVQTVYCRKMCGECKVSSEMSHSCCRNKNCNVGHVLDENCDCRLLCPGPRCDSIQKPPTKRPDFGFDRQPAEETEEDDELTLCF